MGPSTNVDGEASADISAPMSRLLQWGRRRTSTESYQTAIRLRAAPARFNGAVDERRRRATVVALGDVALTWLQWGRRRTSTERSRSELEAARVHMASMG